MPSAETKRLNLLTDVAGLAVGHAHDSRLRSGVTVVLFDQPAIASVAILGGAAAARDTQCLEPEQAVEAVDAIVLSGGSSFGLDAASGVQAHLREQGRGFPISVMRVPIVPQAICFDLLNGGDKDWGRYPPYRELGYEACGAATNGAFALGTAGGGYGASTVNLKGGVGSASAVTTAGHTVAALMVVNALGSAVVGEGPHFWAAPFEREAEFGGLGPAIAGSPGMTALAWKGGGVTATTLGIVATDATLTKSMAKRLAVAAHDGFARALRIAHALFDGDTLFAASTGERALNDPFYEQIELGAVAADCVARAIARGVYEATAYPDEPRGPPAWQDLFGHRG